MYPAAAMGQVLADPGEQEVQISKRIEGSRDR